MPRLAIIAYDITSNRRRSRVLRVLKRWRLGGQKSVHECNLSHAEATELYLQLHELIDPACDRLLLAWSPDSGPAIALGIAARVARGPLRTLV